MNIGLPREVKDNEFRVGLVPAGVHALSKDGHQVLIESNAGEGSGFSDEEYQAAGGTIVASADDLYSSSDLVVKVKEPTSQKFPRLRKDQILFSFLHLAPLPELTQLLLDKKLVAIAYETISDKRGGLPL